MAQRAKIKKVQSHNFEPLILDFYVFIFSAKREYVPYVNFKKGSNKTRIEDLKRRSHLDDTEQQHVE